MPDPIGNLLAIQDTSPAGTGSLDFSASYTYDNRNRISSWTRPGLPGPEHFSYDKLGNLTGNRVSTAGATNQDFTDARPHAVHAAAGSTFGYDADGNVASEEWSGGARYFSFDSQSRLVCTGPTSGSCVTLEVGYEPGGSRVRDRYLAATGNYLDRFYADEFFTKAGGQADFHIFAFGQEIAYKRRTPVTLRTAGTWGLPWEPPEDWPKPAGWGLLIALAGAGWLLVFVRVPQARERPGLTVAALALAVAVAVPPFLARAGGGGSGVLWRRWLLADPIGSQSVVVQEDGTVERETVYTPFGAIHADWGTDSTGSTIFAGHRREQTIGLQYMRARWQNPRTGTFLSVDPLVGNTADPQSFNAYSYARNNPIRYVDPTGEQPVFNWTFVCYCFGECPPTAIPISTPSQQVYQLEESGRMDDRIDDVGLTPYIINWLKRILTLTRGQLIDAVAKDVQDWKNERTLQLPDVNLGPEPEPTPSPGELIDAAEPILDATHAGGAEDPDAAVPAPGAAQPGSPGDPETTRWEPGSSPQAPTRAGTAPSDRTVTRREWKNEALNPTRGDYTAEDMARMRRGLPPQRYNPDKGGIESMERSHEPVPRRHGGTETVPRWPKEHAEVDPMRRPGY